jgi:putative transcriptional regulator
MHGVIYIRLQELLDKKKKSIYWLASASGVPYPTLYKIWKKKYQTSINLIVLSKICSALNCLPGDLLEYIPDREDELIKEMVKAKDQTEKKRK